MKTVFISRILLTFQKMLSKLIGERTEAQMDFIEYSNN